jgi:hypothetical protein
MSISVQKYYYSEFGECLKVTNGKVDIIAALGFGIRILHFGLAGMDNVFCLAPGVKVSVGETEWSAYGGHRLWLSPEEMPKTYFPDDLPIGYEIKNDTVILTQPLDGWANVAKQLEFTISDNKAKVLHRITNRNDHPIEFAVAAVSMMAPGGIEIIPFTGPDTGLTNNRSVSVWPYTDMNDSRVKWLKDHIILTHDSSVKAPFKIGVDNASGWAAYVNGQNVFIKRYRYIEEEKYPDNNVSYETYTCDYTTEMGTLSPLKSVAPGESLEHTEEWSVVHITPGSDLKDGLSVGKFLSKLEPLIQS